MIRKYSEPWETQICKTQIREKSHYESFPRVTRTGDPGRLGLVDRLADKYVGYNRTPKPEPLEAVDVIEGFVDCSLRWRLRV